MQTTHGEVLGRHSAPARRQQARTESTYPRVDNDGGDQQRQVWKSVDRSLEG
jgi:hypothetical protein